jgi:hypothetical protein
MLNFGSLPHSAKATPVVEQVGLYDTEPHRTYLEARATQSWPAFASLVPWSIILLCELITTDVQPE